MKGNDKIIEQLSARLAEELTAINQYMVHAEMYDNWGYKQLAEVIEKRAIDEIRRKANRPHPLPRWEAYRQQPESDFYWCRSAEDA